MPRIGKKKRSDPALYELFKKGMSSRATLSSSAPLPELKPTPEIAPEPALKPEPAPELEPEPKLEPKLPDEQEPTAATTSDESINWLSPGRSLRIPIGYIFLSTAAILLVIIGTFIFGHLRGGQDKEREFGEFGPLDTEDNSALIAQDPMGQDSQALGDNSIGNGAAASNEQSASRANNSGISSGSSGWGPLESDPRQEGYNYYILIHTTQKNARKLAQFCRDEQIRAHIVVLPGRMNQYQVFVLPGYRRGESNSAQIIELKSRLKAVTRKWNLHINSRDDLSYYPERFGG